MDVRAVGMNMPNLVMSMNMRMLPGWRDWRILIPMNVVMVEIIVPVTVFMHLCRMHMLVRMLLGNQHPDPHGHDRGGDKKI